MSKKISKPLVVVIILNWNGASDTIACIHSLRKLNYDNVKILVVDNASNNEDISLLEKEFGKTIDLIKNKQNDGYAQGNNIGIELAKRRYQPDYYWLLNNDTVVDQRALTELVAFAGKNTKVSIIGSFIQYWHSSLIYCLGGGTINLWTGIDRLWGAKLDYHKAFKPKHFSYISGCSLFFSGELLKVIQGFDPDYFLYSEEADFCIRAQRAGHQIGYCQNSIIYHKSAQSTGYYSPVYIYYFLRNKLLFMKKNARWWHWITFVPFFIFYYCVGFIWLSWRKNGNLPISLVLQSISDFARKRWSYQPIRNKS